MDKELYIYGMQGVLGGIFGRKGVLIRIQPWRCRLGRRREKMMGVDPEGRGMRCVFEPVTLYDICKKPSAHIF